MKDTPPTPPDMTREQSRELKYLLKHERQLSRCIDRVTIQSRAQRSKLERQIERHATASMREAERLHCEYAKPIRAEIRQLTAALHRTREDRTPECRELASVRRRIAILEGRLGS